MTKTLNILDTTLREGEIHPGISYSTNERKEIGLDLVELGTPRIEFPLLSLGRGAKLTDITSATKEIEESSNSIAIIQCRSLKSDIESAQQYEVKGCAVYLAVSEIQRKNKLNEISIEETINRLTESMTLLKECGFKYRRAVLEDVSKFFSAYKGKEDTIENFTKLIKAVNETEATIISLPDTFGALTPEQSIKMFKTARQLTKKELAGHFHNDYGRALTNSIAVIEQELIDEIQVSIYGLGARNGIPDHYEISVYCLDDLNIDIGENRDSFWKTYHNFEKITKIPIPWRHPLKAIRESAGTHIKQQLKNKEGYIPKKKLLHDFNEQEIIHEAGKYLSKQQIQILIGSLVDEKTVIRITNKIAGYAQLRGKNILPIEVRDLIQKDTGIKLSIEDVSKVIYGSNFGFLILKLDPKTPARVMVDDISSWEGVKWITQIYGSIDMLIACQLKINEENTLEKVKKKYRKWIQSIEEWFAE
ncbi:MAG TPA: hypothetical protein QGH92_01010 [Candidatus Parcubacteria bacterium]|nr:hypothetical protein [Candidatus Parcubacteria bacterium]